MGEAAIAARALTHHYGQRRALDAVSLEVQGGEAMALLGPNGSGKTTLFKILSTLVAPQEGSASILGLDVVRNTAQVRQGIGVVFQSPSLDRQLTAMENLRHHGHLHGLRGGALDERSMQRLRELGLEARANERVERLSGGLRRRVELAKSLLPDPQVLLMDEPSTGLDPLARRELWETVHELRRQRGLTVLLTTHLMDEADECDRVAILDRGRLVACDSPSALRQGLAGDVISVSSDDPDALRIALRDKLGIEADPGGPTLRFERPRGHELVPQIIEALPGMVRSVSVGRPTLADVFTRLTGRELGDNDDQAP